MSKRLPAWLETAIIYNIYPQSYFDSNGDGIGDLRGIIEKLDYIKSLGVSCIWLNPIYCSPFQDAGYDVTDHYRVAPRYGTKKDLRCLLRECHRRDIRLLLDLIPGHTSNQHPWFRQSAKSARNRYSDWYIWSQGGFGDADANMVRGYGDRDGHYKPNFFWFQPALNYGYARPKKAWQLPTAHPAARQVTAEFRKLMKYWLDFGIDGFRIDMAASLIKEDPNNRANRALWRATRRWIDRDYPGRILVSEWSWPSRSIASGFHIDFLIHFNSDAYTSLFRLEPGRNVFSNNGHSYFDADGQGDIGLFLKTYLEALTDTEKKGFISIPTGNHDLPRINTGRSVNELKVAHAFLFTMPGVPTLYYGDEIGMRNQSQLPSHEGGYIRTGARTPMQWDSTKNCGFSAAPAAKLYLPIDRRKSRPTVEAQEAEPNSLLQHVRRLIALRKNCPALGASGSFVPIHAKSGRYPFVYMRRSRSQTMLVAVNPSGDPVSVSLKIRSGPSQLLMGAGSEISERGGEFYLKMNGISYGIYEIEHSLHPGG